MAVKTFKELTEDVAAELDDSSFTLDGDNSHLTKKHLNGAIRRIASKVLLPELETHDTVSALSTTNNVSLPTNFHRNLHYCYSTTNNRKIKIYSSVRNLFRWFTPIDVTGIVVGVARRGKSLYYQRLGNETLQVHYYKLPTMLKDPDDKVTELPEEIDDEILTFYALSKLFPRIEDGADGRKPNTRQAEKDYADALKELIAFVGPEPKEPVQFQDELRYDAYL